MKKTQIKTIEETSANQGLKVATHFQTGVLASNSEAVIADQMMVRGLKVRTNLKGGRSLPPLKGWGCD